MDIQSLLVTADNTTGISLTRLLEAWSLDMSFNSASAWLALQKLPAQVVRRNDDGHIVTDRILSKAVAEKLLQSQGVHTELSGMGTTRPTVESAPTGSKSPSIEVVQIHRPTLNRSIDNNGDARLLMEWEICKRLIDGGTLSAEESDQMLRDIYERVTGKTVKAPQSQDPDLDAITAEMIGSLSVDFAEKTVAETGEKAHQAVITAVSPMTGCLISTMDRQIPDVMPEGYSVRTIPEMPLNVLMDEPKAVYCGDRFVARLVTSDPKRHQADALRLAWNHHDLNVPPPGFHVSEIRSPKPCLGLGFSFPRFAKRVCFTMPGHPIDEAPTLQLAYVKAWNIYRSQSRNPPVQDEDLTLITASDLAVELGTYPQTIGEAVQGVNRYLGIDIRKDDRYTRSYYENGDRTAQRNWKRYRLTPEGRALVEDYLRTMGRIV